MTQAEQKIPDFQARQDALDITNSIAVQAPAGSGKTELLSLRFLKLLAVCQYPEEVLAITFTKKAANEMGERIVSTLEWAQHIHPDSLEKQLDQDRYRIAMRVLAQDKDQGWQLLQSPNRLRIQTIDSFSNFLASRLPVLSNFGGPVQTNEQPDDCYQLAVRNCLKMLDEDLPVSSAIGELMLHFDNDTAKLESLLSELLKQREQWIGDIVGVANSPQQAMEYLTGNLLELVEESLNTAAELAEPYADRLIPLINYACKNLEGSRDPGKLPLCAGLKNLPASEYSNINTWLGITQFLLVKDISKVAFRKKVDKNVGFPAPAGSKEQQLLRKEKKDEMNELLGSLQNSPELLKALDYLRRLPLLNDDELSWEFLNTLTQVLPVLIAQLELAFTQKNKVDYPQVSLAALRALGSDENPTDLALSLDYQIKHILVDEFQDTSSSQLELLRKLTAGWEQHDGRTLFVVGDAMQSCYGFRNANVGLFIRLRENGLAHIPMVPIDLVANFRSDTGVVEWVNSVFSSAFPQQNDISRGAVCYSHSHAVHPKDIEPAVSSRIYNYDEGCLEEANIEEAAYIADEITRLRSQHPQRSIAILVRSRSHLKYLLPTLREAEIPWLANKIDSLSTLPIITDLMSLTSAICNQADRLSWLAILRAPWCGISLEDLHAIANHYSHVSVLESLTQFCTEQSTSLSTDGLRRISGLTQVLKEAVSASQQISISRVIRTTFNKLNGEQIIRSESERASLESFFDLLKSSEVAGTLEDFSEFKLKVSKSFVSGVPGAADPNPVQIMTIHNSKGLEFDHVFLPGLSRHGRGDDKSLLLWHQRLNQQGENKLFLATLSATGNEDNNLYSLLRYEKTEKLRLESTRLLYIGITRAMKSVYLSATLEQKEDKLATPGSRTLLATIWDSLDQNAVDTIAVKSFASPLEQQSLLHSPPSLMRLPSEAFDPAEETLDSTETETDSPVADLTVSNQLQIEVGNLVHEMLQNYLTNKQLLDDANLEPLRHYWRNHLAVFDFDTNEIDEAVHKIETSLQKTLESTELDWVFDHEQKGSAAELALQSYSNGFVHTHVIDRTLIDDQGVRWIIDYKSSEPATDQSREDFLEEQAALYNEQLARYRELFQEEENKGLKTALLFTSFATLHEC